MTVRDLFFPSVPAPAGARARAHAGFKSTREARVYRRAAARGFSGSGALLLAAASHAAGGGCAEPHRRTHPSSRRRAADADGGRDRDAAAATIGWLARGLCDHVPTADLHEQAWHSFTLPYTAFHGISWHFIAFHDTLSDATCAGRQGLEGGGGGHISAARGG